LRNNSSYCFNVSGVSGVIKIDTNTSAFATLEFGVSDLGKVDFLEMEICEESTEDSVSKTVSLYEKLRVVEESPDYIIKSSPAPNLESVGVGEAMFGNINNLDPLLANMRDGSVPSTSIRQLLSELGIDVKSEDLTDEQSVQNMLMNQTQSDFISLKTFNECCDSSSMANIGDEIRNNYHVMGYM